jgi:hypothetical protein
VGDRGEIDDDDDDDRGSGCCAALISLLTAEAFAEEEEESRRAFMKAFAFPIPDLVDRELEPRKIFCCS